MDGNDLVKLSPESVAWQDYRSSNRGMVVFYASDPVSELPIRVIPEELPSDILPEPNYETGTYGLYGCGKSRIRNAFAKEKLRYLFFVTKYEGSRADYRGRLLITGYFRIAKTAEVKKLHIRYGSDYSCIDEPQCTALRADEVRFVALEDAFAVTEEVMKAWNYKARLTKQTRIMLDEQNTGALLTHLQSKPDVTAQYVAETKRLQPHGEEEEQKLEFEDYKGPAQEQ
ncbi:MAG: hypothetical protein JW699_06720 [Chitinispirillaceae bacterium]|nr:hypothetical protein [Chitinispirillaceae bacterium]